MKDVEQFLPSFRWADEIKLSQADDELTFVGKRFYEPQMRSTKSEIVNDYLRNISGSIAGDESNAPHYLFANAESQSALFKFMKRFGPITSNPTSICISSFAGPNSDSHGIEIQAKESWETVRKERITFDAVFALYAELHSQEPDTNKLLESAAQIQLGTSTWMNQFGDERAAAMKSPQLSEGPRWYWDNSRQSQIQKRVAAIESYVRVDGPIQGAKRATAAGHLLLCDILNAFPVNLTHFHGVIDVPSENLGFGIRHVLYYLVRCDYLRASPLARCAWKDCTKWFKVGPQGSPCCTPEHALKHRQWLYYHEGKGKKLRTQRYKKIAKSSKEGRK